MCELQNKKLLNSNLDWRFNLFFFKGDSKHTIFEFGFDGSLFFFDLDWKSDSTGEFAPVTFLNVPSRGVFVFATAKDTGDG